MTIEHNEYQLNVNVVNMGEKDQIVLQAQQWEDNDAKH